MPRIKAKAKGFNSNSIFAYLEKMMSLISLSQGIVIVAALCCFVWRLSTVSKSLELGKLHENRKIDLLL